MAVRGRPNFDEGSVSFLTTLFNVISPQYHRLPADGELPSDPVSDEAKELGITPCKPHSSRITSLSACNCGRIQDHREDPFDLKVNK